MITAATLVKPTGINQLYQAAFTPLPIANHKRHFVVAVLDCFSRYLLALQVSPIRTTPELIKGLDQALQEARLLSDLPTDRAITLVIDGTGLDTQVFSDYVARSPFRLGTAEPRTFHSLGSIRRLLWTLKDEETGVNLYQAPEEAQRSLESFRRTYNFERPHQALGYKVPADFFCNKRACGPALKENQQ